MDRPILVVLLGLLSLSYAAQCPKQKTSPGREVVCYTSTSDLEQLTDSLCKCTTLVHQGYDLRNLSTYEFESFRKSLKEINPPLQLVISVEDPAKILRTSATVRQETTARLIRILKQVDGVELNMTAGTKERLFHFVKGLKDEMVRKSYDKRIFMVLPTKPEDLAKQFDLKELSKYVDLFTVATHYLVDEDEAYHTFHPSRLMGLFDLVNTDSLIDLISGLGAPKRKILVSVPASAYRFTLKNQDDNAPRSATNEKDPVIIDRKQLCDSMNKGEWTIERDEDLTAPYAFKNTSWIAFEDQISVGIKGKYALLRDLPGLAVRDIENDLRTKCGKPVTHEVHNSFSDFKRKSRAAVLNALEDDLHQSQITYPNQVKSSDFRVVRVVDTEGHIRVVRENTQTEFSCTRQGYFVHPKSCNRFYRCVKFNQEVEDYSVFEFDCPAGLSFDERTEVCVWPGSLPQGSPCPGSSEIAPVARMRFKCPSQPGYYADPQNGRWFFACIDLGGPEFMAYEFRCPYGLVFDEQKLVCEWPWLVPGYSENSYMRTEYDNRGYGAGSTSQGTGGYVTGGLPGGYSGSTGAGDHGAGGDYSGSNAGGVGGYSGADYSGSGQGVGGGHSGGSGFSGPAGVSYSGSNTGDRASSLGQGISSGAGYSGSTAAHGGVDASGQSGYTGTTGGGYAGSTGGSYSGSTDSRYKGTGADYSGSTGGSYYGSTSGAYAGATSDGHGGSSGGGYSVVGGNTFTGATGGVHGGSTDSGYTGSVGGGYAGATGGHGGSTGSGYTGSVGGGYAGTTGGHGGSTGSGYTGSVDGGYSGTTGGVHGGYSGSAGGVHGGSTGSGYTGSVDGGYSGSTGGVHGGSTGSGYTGSVDGGYSGTTGGVHGGSTGSGYTGSVGGGYSGSSAVAHGATGAGYSDQTATSYQGSTSGSHGGSTGAGYQGSTVGTGAGYSQTASGGYVATSGGHAGSSGVQYSGTPGLGSSTISGHIGSGFSTGDYEAGSDGTRHDGYSGLPSAQYPGASKGSTVIGLSTGVDHSGSTGYSTASGSAYVGSSGGTTQDGYSLHEGTTYTGSDGTRYSGISQGGYSTPGRKTPGGTISSQVPIYSSTGTTGSGYVGSTRVSGHQGQSPGVPLTGHGSGLPGVTYIPTAGVDGHSNVISTSSVGDQIYVTGGQITDNGIPTGSLFPGHSGGYITNDLGVSTGKGGITSGTTIYHGSGGIQGGFGTSAGQGDLNITLVGSGVPSIGTTTYHGSSIGAGSGPFGGYSISGGTTGTGAIITGQTVQGSIVTDDSSSGTLITHGDTSGSIVTGSVDQGSIVTGGSYPGYTKNGASVPGYVVSGGVKTIYPNSGAPSTVVQGTGAPGITLTGTPAPGTILRGEATPGVVLTGQTSAGVSLGGSIEQGTVVGSTGSQYFTDSGYTTYHGSSGTAKQGTTINAGTSVKIGSVPVSPDTGYKTNEYHDNGGRGTIKFNNGYVTSKYTENDIPDYRPTGGTLPDTLIPGIQSSGGVSYGTTLSGIPTQTPGYSTAKSGSLTPSGFTKTGPTRTGITTATLGGRGSYVISTGKPRTTVNPDNIGENAFAGNVAGYTKSSTESTVKTFSEASSTRAQDFNRVDTSKITLGPAGSTGYSYPKPSIAFETGGVTRAPVSPIAPTDGSVLTVTTPTPFLNVEVHNTPSIVDSAPITAAPAVVNTYTYSKATSGQYQGSSLGTAKVSVGSTNRRPTPTATPLTYTTGPLESYKTTVFEAARIPVAISTVQPYDDGYKNIGSPSAIPVAIIQDEYPDFQSGSLSTHSQSGLGVQTSFQQTSFGTRKDYGSSTPSPTPGAPSYTPTKSRRPPSYTVSVPTVTYGPSTVTPQPEINYVSSTISPDTGYSYSTSKSTFGQGVTSSTISDSLKPQTQYLPTDSISPAIGVTYRKPFPAPGITYQQSTPSSIGTPGSSKGYSYSGSSASTSSSSSYFGAGISTETGGTGSGGSPTNLGIPRDEVGKLITNYDRGAIKYTPSVYDTYTGTDVAGNTGSTASNDFSRTQTLSSYSGQSYITPSVTPFRKTQKPIVVTTYPAGYSKPSSITSTYEVSTVSTTSPSKGKVIVKWSDLHPLLLGKLGAECTCKADPFANLRGPGKKLIPSSRGQVDLSNYDESEVYVDLEKDGAYDDGDYVTNYDSSSPEPLKISNQEGPSVSLIGNRVSSPNEPQYRGKPSTTYLPGVSSTVAPGFANNYFGSPSTPTGRDSFGHRAGKKLYTPSPSANAVGEQGAAFDRYGPGGLRGLDETLEGVTDCARPGLFRHPNFCNKFYACHWDDWKKKFTLHVFNCPVHLTFDNSAGACNWPSKGPACQDDNLLV